MSSIAKVGRLAGKVAIVTGRIIYSHLTKSPLELTISAGGGSGYGAGIAKLFAEQGAKVVVADINEDGGKRTVQAMPDSMIFHKTNVARQNDWRSVVEATQDAFGSITCLVNNAGTTYRNKGCLHIHEGIYSTQLMLLAADPGGHRIRLRQMF